MFKQIFLVNFKEVFEINKKKKKKKCAIFTMFTQVDNQIDVCTLWPRFDLHAFAIHFLGHLSISHA